MTLEEYNEQMKTFETQLRMTDSDEAWNEVMERINDFQYEHMREFVAEYELPPPILSEMVSTIPCGIVRHVHCATTPSGKALRHTLKCYLVRLWRVGTNTLYILRAIGSWFVRYMAQPYIYSFQGSD